MTEWRECKLSDVMEIIGGGTPKTSVPEYWNGNIPWLSVADFNNGNRYVYDAEKRITELGLKNSSTKILKKGHLIISARGTVGAIAQLGRDMAFNQSCYGLTANSLSTNDFLFYLLKQCIVELKQQSNGGVFDTIIRETFDSINISLPPLPEQKTIAEVLSSLDDKIDLLTRQNKTLEDLAQAYFRKWFIEDASDEWEVGKLGDYIEIYDSKRVPLSNIEREKMKNGTLYPYYGAATIMDYVNDYLFDGEYILMGEDGTVETEDGYPVLQFATGKFWVNNHAHVLTAKSPFNNYFIWFFLKQCNISNIVTGAVQPKINQENLKNIDIQIPNLNLINSANHFFANIFTKILGNSGQIRTLSKLRDNLLPKLISGEIRVKM